MPERSERTFIRLPPTTPIRRNGRFERAEPERAAFLRQFGLTGTTGKSFACPELTPTTRQWLDDVSSISRKPPSTLPSTTWAGRRSRTPAALWLLAAICLVVIFT